MPELDQILKMKTNKIEICVFYLLIVIFLLFCHCSVLRFPIKLKSD